MNEQHVRWYTPHLSRDFEMLVFGHAGYPVILFPTSLGRYYQNKDFGLVGSVAELLTVNVCRRPHRGPAIELAMTEQSAIVVDQNGLSRCVRGRLVYEPNIREIQFAFPQHLARAGLVPIVIAPLLTEGKVFGVLVTAPQTTNGFSSGEYEFLGQLSDHVAPAAHQSQPYSALQEAYCDLRNTQQAVMQQERLRVVGEMANVLCG